MAGPMEVDDAGAWSQPGALLLAHRGEPLCVARCRAMRARGFVIISVLTNSCGIGDVPMGEPAPAAAYKSGPGKENLTREREKGRSHARGAAAAIAAAEPVPEPVVQDPALVEKARGALARSAFGSR